MVAWLKRHEQRWLPPWMEVNVLPPPPVLREVYTSASSFSAGIKLLKIIWLYAGISGVLKGKPDKCGCKAARQSAGKTTVETTEYLITNY